MQNKWQGKKILIVDDEKSLSNIYADEFTYSGATAKIVDSVDLAIEELKNSHYDLILLDIVMPKGSGYQLLNQTQFVLPPVVVVTGFPFEPQKCQMPAISVLRKPFDWQVLNAQIELVFSQQ